MKKTTYIQPSISITSLAASHLMNTSGPHWNPGDGSGQKPVIREDPEGDLDAKKNPFNLWEDDEENAGTNDRF